MMSIALNLLYVHKCMKTHVHMVLKEDLSFQNTFVLILFVVLITST